MATKWNPAGRGRVEALTAARRRAKDPFNRGAPVVRVPPNLCPLGKCEHLAGLHEQIQAGTDGHGWPTEGARCLASGCDCEGPL